ncbi:MAG TPA: LCP family protein [Candidatus Sulfotelmatobacter sp.]|nr:LCP family protein [Candidatus Sulfotelmatobacter sp.]
MQPQPPQPSGTHSPFVAAFLSFLFPGLGQAYAGHRLRAVVLASPLVLVIALLGGMLVSKPSRDWLIAQFVSTDVLTVLLGLNALLLLYRLVVIVDAYRLARGAAPLQPSLGAPRRRAGFRPLGVLGLLAVLVVTPMAHLGVARYDLLALDALNGLTSTNDEPSFEPSATDTAGTTATVGSTGTPGATATATLPQWNGTGRLNILLVGSDQRPGDTSFNTDTMIVASIDPVTKQVGMFSLPRDTEGVPLPSSWPAHAYYSNGLYPAKINSLWARAAGSPGLFPFPGSAYNRGMQALKGALGALYQLDIQYYVAVNFQGFQNIVDTLGGVTVDVQLPVTDDADPQPNARDQNIYIMPGIQHMTGAQALIYARARHASSDFDRAQRQQRVILSVRQQMDLSSLLDFNTLEALVNDLKGAVHTDIPSSLFPSLVSLGEQLDLNNLRSLVFTPPQFAVECNNPALSCYYSLTAKIAPIRQAIKDAFTIPAALAASRTRVQAEGATIDVLNGTSNTGQATNVVDWLQYQGLDAEVSTINGGHAATLGNPQTIITVYNGAEADLPETIKVLEAQFGVQIVTKDDPTITTQDFILIETGTQTPSFKTPSG